MLTPIANRSVIVTGASKGIGKGIACAFAARGARVLLTARTAADLEATAEELRSAGKQAIGIAADVCSTADMESVAQRAVEKHGGIDILCVNAGIFPSARLEDMSPEDWDEVHDINLKGTFLTVRACLPALKSSPHGRIIVTSSITGPITGLPGWSHYGASKAGQLGFVRTAALELARYGITVNAILPGNIRTEGLEALGDQYIAKMIEAVPLRRLGSVEDIAHAAIFLASDEAAFITGQTLVVDGGQVLPESLSAIE
jgi:3-oxoacyl-[acyl-carrier protein] reductase